MMPGMKRQLDQDAIASQGGNKRRKIVTRKIQHTQPGLPDDLPLEDSVFYGSQLIRGISVALKAAGFDGVTPAALEAFRAETEEYMLNFCGYITQSMSSARRTQALPSDFINALSHHQLQPRDLIPQLSLSIPSSVTLPPVPLPLPEEALLPDLEEILGPEISGAAEKAARAYIPKHFPNFPNTSTWKATPAYADRETDPQKLREKANEEGIQAEKALRELMAAAKFSKQKMRMSEKNLKRERMWEETLDALAKEDEKYNEMEKARETELNMSFDFDGAVEPTRDAKRRKDSSSLQISGPIMVNYESKYWRKSAQKSI